MTFTNEEVTKLMCILINLSHSNYNNISDAVNEINNRQKKVLGVAADLVDIAKWRKKSFYYNIK